MGRTPPGPLTVSNLELRGVKGPGPKGPEPAGPSICEAVRHRPGSMRSPSRILEAVFSWSGTSSLSARRCCPCSRRISGNEPPGSPSGSRRQADCCSAKDALLSRIGGLRRASQFVLCLREVPVAVDALDLAGMLAVRGLAPGVPGHARGPGASDRLARRASVPEEGPGRTADGRD